MKIQNITLIHVFEKISDLFMILYMRLHERGRTRLSLHSTGHKSPETEVKQREKGRAGIARRPPKYPGSRLYHFRS